MLDRLVLAVALLGAAVSGCGADEHSSTITAAEGPAGLQRILGERPPLAEETFQVFVCKVPLDTTDPMFGDSPLRLSLDPAAIAEQMNNGVRPYFERLSGDRYHPQFRGGAVLTMAADETHDGCVERAIDATDDDVATTMVVADAENIATAPGGWGRPGAPCRFGFCPATDTRRALYVGASDFHPDWGDVPLLDLIEHEIGHTLGLPHSGDGVASEDQHTSALDVMSNSAAPRELTEAAEDAVEGPSKDLAALRKDAQDTLAINRLALGWLPAEDMSVVSDHGGRFDLASSSGPAGLRLLILPITDETFLTVEHLTATGLDDFLPESGLAVHRIDQTNRACARSDTDETLCTGVERAQITLGSPAPHVDLLDREGDSWVLDGWTITVRSVGDLLGVEVSRSDR